MSDEKRWKLSITGDADTNEIVSVTFSSDLHEPTTDIGEALHQFKIAFDWWWGEGPSNDELAPLDEWQGHAL